MALSPRAQKLKSIISALSSAADSIIEEWALEDAAGLPQEGDKGPKLSSKALYDARRIVLAATGSLTELVDEPQTLLMKVSTLFYESRALHIIVEHRIPDLLAKAHGDQGVHINVLSRETGINSVKLERLLRTLCTVHVLREVQRDHYANNSVSEVLVGNEGLSANIMMQAIDLYDASNRLPDYLKDPVAGQSDLVTLTPMQLAKGTTLPYWEWLEEPLVLPDGSKGVKPQLPIFGKAMMGGGRVFSPPHVQDYPWKELGKGTVVDVGGGVGGFCMDIARTYPDLNLVLQDRPPVIAQAKEVWAKALPDVVETRMTFMPHDFFQVNPVNGAAVYFLRYIIHDWQDDKCTEILKAITAVMAPTSKIVIADIFVNTTLGCEEIESPPAPLLPNYGYASRLTHHRDMTMMCAVNGRERTPEMFKELAKKAGLVVTKFYDVRGAVGLVEMALP